MKTCEQIKAFGQEIDNLVERFRSEFDIPYAAVIGVLTFKANALGLEAMDLDDEEDPDGV